MSKIYIEKIGKLFKWTVYNDYKVVKMGIENNRTNAIERANYFMNNVR